MKRIILIILLFAFPLYFSYGQHFSKRKFLKLISKEKAFKGATVSAVFYDMKKKKKLVDFNSKKYMTPASNMKLLTLLGLISSFDSIPALYYKRKKGKFYFWSSGYPLVAHPKYQDSIVIPFLKSQKDTIIYLPRKIQSKSLGPGWAWDDVNYYFSAERSGFPFHGNVVKLTKGDGIINYKPKLFKELKSRSIDSLLIQTFIQDKKKDSLFIPFSTSDRLFVKLLSDAIRKDIAIDYGKEINLSENYKTLYSTQKDEIFKLLIKDSDNLTAESLTLMVSGKEHPYFDINKGIEYIIDKELSNISPKPIWIDGSGLSRYNMITAESLVFVLNRIYKKISLLSIKRFFPVIGSSEKDKSYEFNNSGFKVYAKTGTLKNNHCLSGYILKDGRVVIFSFMVNHHISSLSGLQRAMASVIEQVIVKL